MCAIAGMIGLESSEEIMDAMQKTMVRRGPDGSGRYRSSQAALLHTRLAIIDPENGSQPMLLSWGGERYVMVYNGELYNTQEIKHSLEMLGHSFVSHSDTEVLLHAYAQWKEECVHKLNGIFAFAVWEERKQTLFMARDRMGVKPLFYMHHRGGLLFSSEIKTILAYPTVDAQLDANGAAQIILLGPGRMPGSGVLRGICELEPGYCARYENEKLNVYEYWRLMDSEHTDSFDETVQKVRFLVEDAIIRQTVSDVPIGTFLSGGLDSSLISSICAKYLSRTERRLSTFSVDYEHNDKFFKPDKFQPNADVEYIQTMQKAIESAHYTTILTPDQLVRALRKAVYARDLPGMADVDSSLLAFCADVSTHVKVGLSGECADEIFGGYPWYRDPAVRSAEGFPWAQNTDVRTGLMHPDLRRTINGNEFVMDAYSDTISRADILPGTSPFERKMKQMVYLNQRWFMQTLLDRKDRMSMYNSLEVRVPFCDHRIAEYMYSVPWEYKDHNGIEKGLLRYAMQDVLPEQVLWRKKSPYPKTYDPRYEDLVRTMLQDLLLKEDAPVFSVMDKNAVRCVLEQEQVWPWYGQLMKKPQTMAYILMINMWLTDYRIHIL